MLYILIRTSLDIIGILGPQKFNIYSLKIGTANKDLLFRLTIPQLILAILAITNYHVQIITRLSSGLPMWYIVMATALIETSAEAAGHELKGLSKSSEGGEHQIKSVNDDTTPTAVVDTTLYIYGGRSKKTSLQTDNTWNNDFLKLDLSKDFDIGSAPIQGLPKPSGPPAVALGYLWNDLTDLYLYGGQYSDSPPATPDDFQLWKYSVSDGSWSVPDATIQGGGEIKRAAEGAGVSVPNRGKGYYFGGHLDGYTTKGWSQSIPRLYLTSMIEYDMSAAKWINHTEEGASFPERADGVLTYIPWGEEGILLALGGGNNITFSQLNVIDVFDIKNNKWTKQATSGETPKIRVNACAAVFSAPDNSSHNVYMYGGQNLQPAGEQVQYDDMWILTIPSFTWIKVNTDGQSNPPARAGHSCHAYRGQILVIGGYVGQDLSCDTGVYVFDAFRLEWQTNFRGGAGTGGDSTNIYQGNEDIFYGVPAVVVSQVGGGSTGGATVTAPQRTPVADSPLTGTNPDYTYNPNAPQGSPAITLITSTVTGPAGVRTTVITATAVSTGATSGNNNSRSTSVGVIVGATVGGVAFLIGALLFLLFLWYRRKVNQLHHSYEEQQVTQGLVGPDGRPMSMASGGYTAGTENGRSKEDLMEGVEPTFWGMLLQPRRSLRVVNH
ncbi:hypothetical protein H072_1146 [Dactylellina haptotyla CBS 200.50]|uniref:Kelch repeat-containing protein n=1 Tax=Dactylellina haptotyla (strain CBS 200.50) TaxID=1284197 RepID=S8APL1_DACHA|nr:hypothetical protein H072_1146 [Dactylellina haptotyla CBS 200.50]